MRMHLRHNVHSRGCLTSAELTKPSLLDLVAATTSRMGRMDNVEHAGCSVPNYENDTFAFTLAAPPHNADRVLEDFARDGHSPPPRTVLGRRINFSFSRIPTLPGGADS